MITTRDVSRVAAAASFRPEIVEKVLRLAGILQRLDRHETTAGGWVLKGGTAINLVHLEVPRLSVDIDINFVGAVSVDAMRTARVEFERALAACCEREGCTVKRSPIEHAGGKFRLRYPSVLGGTQNLEVDVSYVAHVPLWGTQRKALQFPPGSTVEVPTLALEELAAGKFAALVQRTAARDAFDAANLMALLPDLTERSAFRTAFVCFVAGSRSDARALRPAIESLRAELVERDLEPLLRVAAEPRTRDIASSLETLVRPAVDRLLTWTPGERRFLDALLDRGEIDAEALAPEPDVQARIRTQPMLLWKARNVREHRGLGPLAEEVNG